MNDTIAVDVPDAATSLVPSSWAKYVVAPFAEVTPFIVGKLGVPEALNSVA